MDSLAINGRSGTQHYVSISGTEKKDDQTGVLGEAKESPVPRAQFSSPITSCFKAIGNRNCKTSDSAVNALTRARGAWALSDFIFAEIETFAPINHGKVLCGIKILKELVGNDSKKIQSVLTWGTDNNFGESVEHEFHRMGLLDAFLEFEEVKSPWNKVLN